MTQPSIIINAATFRFLATDARTHIETHAQFVMLSSGIGEKEER